MDEQAQLIIVQAVVALEGKQVDLLAHSSLIYFKQESCLDQPSSISLVAQTRSADMIDKSLRNVMSGKVPMVKVRIGSKLTNRVSWGQWQTHVILALTAQPASFDPKAGHLIKLETRDPLWLAASSPHIRPEVGLASQIVNQVLGPYFEKFELEPTSGRMSLVQVGETDLDFVVSRIIPRSANKDGSANYRLFCRDDVLHFHTVDYKPSLKRFDYAGSGSGINLFLEDCSSFVGASGASGTFVTSFNPYDASSSTTHSSEDKLIRHADAAPAYGFGLRNLVLHRSDGNFELDEPSVVAQYYFDNQRRQAYTATLTAKRTLNLQLNDLVRLNVDQGKSRSPWSGWWTVSRLCHLVDSGALTSTFVLQRGELSVGQTTGGRGLRLSREELEVAYGSQGTRLPILDANIAP